MRNRFVACSIYLDYGNTKYYLNHGVITSTVFGIPTEKGFTLKNWTDWNRLSLTYRVVDYENGIIECKICLPSDINTRLARNGRNKK